MANILYMAISQDGFIAGPGDERPRSDGEKIAFKAFVTTCDAILLGRRAYEIMQDNHELLPGIRYIVATKSKTEPKDIERVNIQTKHDMPDVVRLGIIGGGELNGRLAKIGVIDELFLDIEPITLQHGKRLFGVYDIPLRLKLLESRKIGQTTMQRHYEVVGSQ
jgi:dihydrofolate reductase